jgi:hypothetical protein
LRLSFAAMVIADLSLFCGKESPGDGGFRGDGPVFDDGVATKISLIGVLAAASKSVAMLGSINRWIKRGSRNVTILAREKYRI